jgi:hypothetical protein
MPLEKAVLVVGTLVMLCLGLLSVLAKVGGGRCDVGSLVVVLVCWVLAVDHWRLVLLGSGLG